MLINDPILLMHLHEYPLHDALKRSVTQTPTDFMRQALQVPAVLKVRKATEERKAQRGTSAPQDQRESRAPALALVSPLRVEDR